MACGGGSLFLKVLLAYGDAPGFVANVDKDVSAAVAVERESKERSKSAFSAKGPGGGGEQEQRGEIGGREGRGSNSQCTEWYPLSSSCKTVF